MRLFPGVVAALAALGITAAACAPPSPPKVTYTPSTAPHGAACWVAVQKVTHADGTFAAVTVVLARNGPNDLPCPQQPTAVAACYAGNQHPVDGEDATCAWIVDGVNRTKIRFGPLWSIDDQLEFALRIQAS